MEIKMSDKLKITAIDSGPLKVSNLKSLEFCGKAMEVDGDAFFCRCGESKNAALPNLSKLVQTSTYVGQRATTPSI